MVCGGLRWFVVVCGGLWWFVVDCGGLSFSHTRLSLYPRKVSVMPSRERKRKLLEKSAICR